MKLLILISLAVSGASSWGQSHPDIYRLFPVIECPAVGEEYEKMIAQLDSIKASLKEGANCQNVALNVKSLEDLVGADRQKVLELIQNGSESLTNEQAKLVRDYAENVTKKVSSLMDLFMNSNDCFRDGEPEKQINKLSGFVNEASQLVGQLAGPWGTPIALTGHVVAGFLTGMEQVLKSRAGYDFNKREHWMSFVQNLCTYHGYREQIEHLLNGRSKISELEKLKSKLEFHLEEMSRLCPECRSIQQGYLQGHKESPQEISRQLDPQIQAANARFKQPLGSYTLQSLGLRDWAIGEILRLEKESRSYWSDVSGRHLLNRAKEDIEEFLIRREAPRFIAFQIRRSRADFAEFESLLNREGRHLYHRLSQSTRDVIAQPIANVFWAGPLDLFRALVIKPMLWENAPRSNEAEDLKFAWTNLRDQSLTRLKTAQLSLHVVQSFCSFFKYSGNYHQSLREHCSSLALHQLLVDEAALEKEVASSQSDSSPPILNPGLMEDEGLLRLYSRNKIEALSRALDRRTQLP